GRPPRGEYPRWTARTLLRPTPGTCPGGKRKGIQARGLIGANVPALGRVRHHRGAAHHGRLGPGASPPGTGRGFVRGISPGRAGDDSRTKSLRTRRGFVRGKRLLMCFGRLFSLTRPGPRWLRLAGDAWERVPRRLMAACA